RPARSQRSRKLLRREITWRRKRVNLAAVMAGDPRDDVGRRAEAVDAHAARVPPHPGRAVPNPPRAHPRGRPAGAAPLAQLEYIAGVGDGVLRVTTVDLVTRETGAAAEILPSTRAVLTGPAGVAQPRNPDAIALAEADRPVAQPLDRPHDLVPW